MNDSGLFGSRGATTVWLSLPTSPADHATLTCELVPPLPVTWSDPPVSARAVGPPGPTPDVPISKASVLAAAAPRRHPSRIIARSRRLGPIGHLRAPGDAHRVARSKAAPRPARAATRPQPP